MKNKSPITTHVLDTHLGKPASHIRCTLEILGTNSKWARLGQGTTNTDGRIENLLKPDWLITTGTYRLCFKTDAYFVSQGIKHFYPRVIITFKVSRAGEHHHVPLLLSPFGYSTYRGS